MCRVEKPVPPGSTGGEERRPLSPENQILTIGYRPETFLQFHRWYRNLLTRYLPPYTLIVCPLLPSNGPGRARRHLTCNYFGDYFHDDDDHSSARGQGN